MAEEEEKKEALSTDEAAELERLLEDTGGDEVAAAGGMKGKFQKILGNKKLLMIFGGGALVLILAVVAGVIFLQGDKQEEVPLEEKAVEEDIKEEEDEDVKIDKVNIFKLEPFFLPIRDNGKETGKFISVSANLLLSNSVLHRELNKVLPLIRKSIYNILRRKRPTDFTLKHAHTEERIKKEILTGTNALLLSGTGTINDVFFSRFVVK